MLPIQIERKKSAIFCCVNGIYESHIVTMSPTASGFA
jgi:hypothetical protein